MIDAKKRILCYGDSNTWGYTPGLGTRFPENVRWTGVAANLLAQSCVLLEDGLNGRTTVFSDPYTDFRNGRRGLGYAAVSQAPLDLVVLSLGTNDLKYTGAIGSCKGMDELLRTLQNADACFGVTNDPIFRNGYKALVISPIHLHPDIARLRPESSIADKYEETLKFSNVYHQVCRNRGAWFLDASRYARPSEKDCVHMDAPSHCKLGEAVAAKIKEILSL